MHYSIRLLAATIALGAVTLSSAQDEQQRRRNPTDPQTPPRTGGAAAAGAGFQRSGGFGPSQHQPPKAYEDVITADTKTQDGVFKVHRNKDQILFEIPKSLFSRDLLMSVQVVRTPAGVAGMTAAGIPATQAVIKFEKRGDELLMRIPQYNVRTRNDKSLAYGISRAAVEPIVSAFDVMAYSPEGSAVIDVTRLYNSDPGDFAAGQAVGGTSVDASRSFIELVQAYPQNIEVESQLTFNSGGGGGGGGRGGGGGGAPSRTTSTAYVHYSLLLLPEKPMQPRLKDSRIGYFSTFFTQYDGAKLEAERVGYIDRFRLEKKDPSAAVSDPVKPIVFYIQRDIPNKWRRYIHEAVEAWQPAFLKAGFSNAIIAKDEPTPEQDPNFHAGDLRYSLISWSPSTTQNAEGLHIADPRSGETLHAHVIIWHDVLKLSQNWYFVQASPNNPSAQKLPLSDDLMGDIMRYVVTHEVGHCLGLEHNFKASSAFTVEQLRNRAFTEKYGDEASVMDYGRFNYVAQPGDHSRLIPMIGPYDYFAIQYGYMPAAGPTADSEKERLDAFLSRQATDRTVRFGNSDGNDPGMESEDIGSDPIKASTYGLKNLDRVLTYLMPGCVKYGEDYTMLHDMYRQVVSQRMLELNHVAKLVGGVYDTDYHAGRGGVVYAPVTKAQQAKAVAFIVSKGLNLSPGYYNKAILDRIQSDGYQDLAGNSQQVLMSTLLADTRLGRMFDNEAENGANAYTVHQLVADLQGGVWDELHNTHPKITLARRGLQLRYLEIMDGKLNGAGASHTEFRTIARAALKNLNGTIRTCMEHTHDAATLAHLDACHDRIKDILEGKMPVASASAGISNFLQGFGDMNFCGYDDAPPFFEGVMPAKKKVQEDSGN